MIGVNYDLFWSLNPKSLMPFVKAFDLRKQYDESICWRTGMYVQMAVASVLTKGLSYPSRPLSEKENKPMTSTEIRDKIFQRAKEINTRFRKED